MIQVKKNHMMKLSNQQIQRDEEVMRKSRSVAVGCLASGWVFVDIFSHRGMELRRSHHGIPVPRCISKCSGCIAHCCIWSIPQGSLGHIPQESRRSHQSNLHIRCICSRHWGIFPVYSHCSRQMLLQPSHNWTHMSPQIRQNLSNFRRTNDKNEQQICMIRLHIWTLAECNLDNPTVRLSLF